MAKQDAGVGPMTANQATEIAEAYLCAVRDIRSTQANSPETSYYPALANLFNTVGKTLKPKVLCVMNLKDQGRPRTAIADAAAVATAPGRQAGLRRTASSSTNLRDF
jgi:hypothetical protein